MDCSSSNAWALSIFPPSVYRWSVDLPSSLRATRSNRPSGRSTMVSTRSWTGSAPKNSSSASTDGFPSLAGVVWSTRAYMLSMEPEVPAR
jgi:hypothetical protein